MGSSDVVSNELKNFIVFKQMLMVASNELKNFIVFKQMLMDF